MVASCMIFLASFGNAEMPIEENWATIQHTKECTEVIPFTMIEYVPFYVEFYDEKHLYKALRIGWCESRGKKSAYREEDDDSGIMQFIPNTWNWVAEKFDIPLWDENVLTYFGMPHNEVDFEDIRYTDLNGFKFTKAQFIPYLNIKMSAHLAEDIYTKKDFRDWNSSKWCWENPNYYEKKWREEGY